ncbi:hypothetical protein HDV02_002376 [Globomyces sp. JEL0801]|nr:hypothetical protein HDV02_002376 [Globomyces sp. JEL0801]
MMTEVVDDIDELDDYLDDVLDKFNEPLPNEPKNSKSTAESVDKNEDEVDDAFMKMLTENMSKMLENAGDLDTNELLAELGNNLSVPPKEKEPECPKEFQDKISETLNKLKNSSVLAEQKVQDDVKSKSGFPFGDEASMEAMMKEFEGMMENGNLDDVFGGALNQLVSRELLYEPMKDLSAQYPDWLAQNQHDICPDELHRYKEQSLVVNQIVEVFDSCGQGEPDDDQKKIILDLMQQMQNQGNPPPGLMKDMAPELEIGPDGLPAIPEDMADCKTM